jgi:hypothetical protein
LSFFRDFMKMSYRHIVVLNLTLLILFSSIGFNIITTFCGGCDDQHTSVAIVSSASKSACSCCESTNAEFSCCAIPTPLEESKHHTTSKFAKLDFDATEVKANNIKLIQPVILLDFIFLLNSNSIDIPVHSFVRHQQFSPLEWGKSLLSLNCVLRL